MALPTPDTRRFRRRIKDLAALIEAAFGSADEDQLRQPASPVPRTVAEAYLALLAAAEEAEMVRARLVARPHPPRREDELIRELRERIAVRTIRVNAAESALAEFAGEPPPGPGPHAPGWHRPAAPEV